MDAPFTTLHVPPTTATPVRAAGERALVLGGGGSLGNALVTGVVAGLLDDGLAKLEDYWGGTFDPRPVQRPRIPIWAAARWPARKPVRRAARDFRGGAAARDTGTLLVVDGTAARVWDPETRKDVCVLADAPVRPAVVALTDDGTLAVLAAPGRPPAAWDAKTGQKLRDFDPLPKTQPLPAA